MKLPIFKHILVKRMICHSHSILSIRCTSTGHFKYYFRYSYNFQEVEKNYWENIFGLLNIMDPGISLFQQTVIIKH